MCGILNVKCAKSVPTYINKWETGRALDDDGAAAELAVYFHQSSVSDGPKQGISLKIMLGFRPLFLYWT